MAEPLVVFLLGLSGAGKSSVATWMTEDLGFIHLDIDPGGVDGIDACDLRKEWTAHGNGDPRPIAETARARAKAAGAVGAVLSFPTFVFRREKLDAGAAVGISTLILYGPEEQCLSAFLEREKRTGRGFDAERWHAYNDVPLRVFGGPAYANERMEAFKPDGSRWTREQMVGMVRERLGLA